MGRLVRALAVVVTTALSLGVGVAVAPPAAAAYDPVPVGPAWTPDGAVLATAVSGSRVYVGGEFTGGVAALDAATGALLWRGTADELVRAVAVSSDGTRLLIGGKFREIDGRRHRKLASLSVTDGSVDHSWRASASGLVRDIVVHGDTAYFGGQFKKHNGIWQRSLGAVSVTTGKPVTSFTAHTDWKVHSLSTDGATLVVGGRFTSVNGRPRDSLAAVNLADSSLHPWNPTRACSGCNLAWDVLLDGGTVYTAGRNAGAVVAWDLATSARRWRMTANGDAQELVLAGGMLYVGGHFTEIDRNPRVPRKLLAALDPATGALDDFSTNFVTSYPGIWALAATASMLYVGGYFTAAGPTPPQQYPYFAMFTSP